MENYNSEFLENKEEQDFVFKECELIFKNLNPKKNIEQCKKIKTKINEYTIKIIYNNCIHLSFKEKDNNYIYTILSNFKEIKFQFEKDSKNNQQKKLQNIKKWIMNTSYLLFIVEKLNIKHPVFISHKKEKSLNSETVEEFFNSSTCDTIKESSLYEISYKQLYDFKYANNYQVSKVSFNNDKYFSKSNNLNEIDYFFNSIDGKLLNIFYNKFNLKIINIISPPKNGMSTKILRYFSTAQNIHYYYLDIRLLSDPFIETRVKRFIFESELINIFTDEIKFNEYTNFLEKKINYTKHWEIINSIIKELSKESKIKINFIFDHLNSSDSSNIETIKDTLKKTEHNLFLIYSLEDDAIQNDFLLNLEKQKYFYDESLWKENIGNDYVCLGNNAYYYAINSTQKTPIEDIIINEQLRIYQRLKSFYKNKDFLCLIEISSIIKSKKDFCSSNNNHKNILFNIPLDLFYLKLKSNYLINGIQYRNKITERCIKKFIVNYVAELATKKEIFKKWKGSMKGNLLEELFTVFHTSDQLYFDNIKYLGELIVDKFKNTTIFYNNKYYEIKKNIENFNIFIGQKNENAPILDSAIHLIYEKDNSEDKKTKRIKVLKTYQVTEGKTSTVLKESYTKENLKTILDDFKKSLEKEYKIKYDRVEFQFVLDKETYKDKGKYVVSHCEKEGLDYILFCKEKMRFFDKKEELISKLEPNEDALIIDSEKENSSINLKNNNQGNNLSNDIKEKKYLSLDSDEGDEEEDDEKQSNSKYKHISHFNIKTRKYKKEESNNSSNGSFNSNDSKNSDSSEDSEESDNSDNPDSLEEKEKDKDNFSKEKEGIKGSNTIELNEDDLIEINNLVQIKDENLKIKYIDNKEFTKSTLEKIKKINTQIKEIKCLGKIINENINIEAITLKKNAFLYIKKSSNTSFILLNKKRLFKISKGKAKKVIKSYQFDKIISLYIFKYVKFKEIKEKNKFTNSQKKPYKRPRLNEK